MVLSEPGGANGAKAAKFLTSIPHLVGKRVNNNIYAHFVADLRSRCISMLGVGARPAAVDVAGGQE